MFGLLLPSVEGFGLESVIICLDFFRRNVRGPSIRTKPNRRAPEDRA
jgi:hypothetical protein